MQVTLGRHFLFIIYLDQRLSLDYHINMKNIIGLRELRENTAKYISKVERGESFTVVRRSKPIFHIVSPDEDEGLWEDVVDFTKIQKDGVPIGEVIKRLKKLNG